jgi:hypothetical protein
MQLEQFCFLVGSQLQKPADALDMMLVNLCEIFDGRDSQVCSNSRSSIIQVESHEQVPKFIIHSLNV